MTDLRALMEADLLPCPFCGSAPILHPMHQPPSTHRPVECPTTDCPMHFIWADVTHWQKRAYLDRLAKAEGDAAEASERSWVICSGTGKDCATPKLCDEECQRRFTQAIVVTDDMLAAAAFVKFNGGTTADMYRAMAAIDAARTDEGREKNADSN